MTEILLLAGRLLFGGLFVYNGVNQKSGKASITYTLEQLGIAGVGDQAVGEMLRIVKERSIAKRGLVTLEEFRKIAERVLAGAAHPA